MTKSVGCVTRVLALVGLAAILWLAWVQGPSAWEEVRGDRTEPEAPTGTPSDHLAEGVVEGYAELLRGERRELRITGPEIESLLVHRFADQLPEGVSDPSVQFAEGEVRLGVRLLVSTIPTTPELERFRTVLPDTTSADLRGTLLTLSDGVAVLLVHRVDLAGVPIPRTLYSPILERWRHTDQVGVPTEAVRIPLPAGVHSMYVEQEHLVLTAIP